MTGTLAVAHWIAMRARATSAVSEVARAAAERLGRLLAHPRLMTEALIQHIRIKPRSTPVRSVVTRRSFRFSLCA